MGKKVSEDRRYDDRYDRDDRRYDDRYDRDDRRYNDRYDRRNNSYRYSDRHDNGRHVGWNKRR
ncbi:hypothetical protein HLH10_02360 [Acinetobacter sp. ANC 4277]|nr:hypothetical protein [Acinetobacter terrae]